MRFSSFCTNLVRFLAWLNRLASARHVEFAKNKGDFQVQTKSDFQVKSNLEINPESNPDLRQKHNQNPEKFLKEKQ